ncbi:SDR family NAD(P)-dependent oxidoreductase [Paraburkholderia sp.]|uniref:SDR family NAD(P)-dependent oxidoreductase n=1 Tax=Paraburkholderia sp. TaxID=1926495 RepID=UPI003D6DB441
MESFQARGPFGAKSTAHDVVADLDLKGKTIVLTGCNSGLGLETMKALTGRGAHVIGMARSLRSAQAACSLAGGSTTAMACDLTDLNAVARAANEILATGKPLDAIVANAGIAATPKLEAKYGVELQFLVNHVAHFLLITRLESAMRARTGRIVMVSSDAAIKQAPKVGIMFDNLDGHQMYKPFLFYGQSKLAVALCARELARRFTSRGITVNFLHPGATGGTGLNRTLGFPLNLVLKVARLFMKTAEQGAATQTFLAASPMASDVTGEYWVDCQIAPENDKFRDDALAARLWRVTQDIVDENVTVAL